MTQIPKSCLAEWCRVPVDQLATHPSAKLKCHIVRDSDELGKLMASELLSVVQANNQAARPTRAIIPCGPKCWYAPFTQMVNEQQVSLRNLHVFHMDECLDWEGRGLPAGHPYNFRSFMEQHFYGGIKAELAVPSQQRYWLSPATVDSVRESISAAPLDLTLGGWGQDGHVAYNQARRNPYSQLTVPQLLRSSIRIQENNQDTIMALAHRTFGGAYQFVPPMSVTLGMKECFSAAKIRLYSDTGAWKQTALRVALFSDPTPEYPITLLQLHNDAAIIATRETATHPLSEHPEWEV